MRKRGFDYLLISLLSIILFSCVYFGFKYNQNQYVYFYASFKVNNKQQIIKSFYKEDENTYYFFLPSHYENSDIEIHLNKDTYIQNDDKELRKRNIDIDEIEFNKEYEVIENEQYCANVIFMHSENIPAMYITTSTGDLSFLKVDKKLSDSGRIVFLNEDASIEYFGSMEEISGRGNSTWEQDKKGWEIVLPEEKSLLGMTKASSWILLANFFDDTRGLRNYATYNMAKECGLDTTSELRFIDLYVNKEYMGVYILAEKIWPNEKLDIGDLDTLNNQVNKCILSPTKLSQTVIDNDEVPLKSWSNISSPSNISGGYILERNYGYKLLNKLHIVTSEGEEPFVVRYPSVVSKEESDYIEDIINQVERALFANDYKNPETGKDLLELIDVDSWVLKYMIDEITKSEGAGSTSSYFYKKQNDDKLYGGPIWDYDKTYGLFEVNRDVEELSYSTWYDISPTYWYKQLYNNETANKLIKKYYKERFRPYLLSLNDYLLDNWGKEYIDSFDMDWIRWEESLLYWEDDKQAAKERYRDFDTQIEQMKKWINKRVDFLDSVWLIEE